MAQTRYLVCTKCWEKTGKKNPPVLGILDEGGRVIISRYKGVGGSTVISGDDIFVSCLSCGAFVFEKHERIDTFGVRFFDLRGIITEKREKDDDPKS